MPVSDVRSGPLVSVILYGRSSEAARAILALERTTYREIEVLVVGGDEAQTTRAAASSSIPVRAVGRSGDDDELGVIDGAVATARGELVCLLDTGIEPVNPDWLGHLVETVMAGAVGAGPLLLRAPGRGLVRARQRSADLSILSTGVDLRRSGGAIVPRHLGSGTPYRAGPARPVATVPGLSLACLLVRRSALLVAGGVPKGYVAAGLGRGGVPFADAELGWRLRAEGGHLTNDPRAVAWCHVDEADVPTAEPPPKQDLRGRWVVEGDAATVLDRWGPRLVRRVLLDVIDGAHEWSVEPLRIAVRGDIRLAALTGSATGPRIVEVTSAMRSVDADVVIDAGPEADIRDAPTGLIRVAWVAAASPSHLDEFDLVVVPSEADRARIAHETSKRVVVADLEGPAGLERLRDLLRDWVTARRIGIRIGPGTWKTAHIWGDYGFARSLQRSLEQLGHPTRVRLVRDWGTEAAAWDDATIHLYGNRLAHNRPSQVNVLWQISHPDLATPEQYDTYDHAFVASDAFAAAMALRAHVPVEPLHQATDPERFHPEPGGPRHDLLFVANYREHRPVVDGLVPTDRDLAIYGNGWDEHGLEPRYHRGRHIPNTELRRFYSAASIVLNDTWEDMRLAGFISNRIYDALACGAFVLSDDVAGVADEFDGGLAIYRDAAELRAAVDRYLDDPERRREIAARGRAAVLARHTFDQRAATIMAAIGPRLRSTADPI